MPNFHFYAGCQAFSGKAENFFRLSFATDGELNKVRTASATKIGPVSFNGKPYYGLLMYGVDEDDPNATTATRSMLYFYHSTGDEGQPAGIEIGTWFNYSPAYVSFGEGTIDSDSAEPTQRVLGNAQTPSIYTHNIQESGTDNNPILFSWQYLNQINPPAFNWGRSLTTANTDILQGTIYFDNWQSYLFWGIYGLVNGDGQYVFVRRYNQSGTLIWHRRIQAPAASPSSWKIGKMSGFDTGNVMVPITYQDNFDSVTKVYAITFDVSGNVLNNALLTLYESVAELGSISNLASVVSSRPMWDNIYVGFNYYGFGTGGPATTKEVVVSCSNAQNLNHINVTISNTNLVFRGAVEEPTTGDVIVLCVESNGFLAGDALVVFRLDIYGNVIWQRRATITAKVAGETRILGIIQADISWASDNTFMISLTHDTLSNIGTYQGVGVSKFNNVFSLPMDGSLVGTHTCEFENFDGNPNSQNFIIMDYEEGNNVFSKSALIESPQAVPTVATTNPFTQNTLSAPTRVAITHQNSGGLIK